MTLLPRSRLAQVRQTTFLALTVEMASANRYDCDHDCETNGQFPRRET